MDHNNPSRKPQTPSSAELCHPSHLSCVTHPNPDHCVFFSPPCSVPKASWSSQDHPHIIPTVAGSTAHSTDRLLWHSIMEVWSPLGLTLQHRQTLFHTHSLELLQRAIDRWRKTVMRRMRELEESEKGGQKPCSCLSSAGDALMTSYMPTFLISQIKGTSEMQFTLSQVLCY